MWRLRLYKKVMSRVLLSSLMFGVLVSHVQADPFYPSGDAKYCEFAQTSAISIGSLPGNSIASGMTYATGSVQGKTTAWIRSTDFEDVGDVTYPDARRKNGIADFVAVPPGTTVDLDAYFFNGAGHSIKIYKAVMYTSRANPALGDLTRVGSPGVSATHSFLYNGVTVTRRGKATAIDDWMTVPAHNYPNLPKGVVFKSFKTVQPVVISGREVWTEFSEKGELLLKYKTKLKNVSTYNLSGIQVEETFPDGERYSQSASIGAGKEVTLEYEKCLCYDYPYEIVVPRLKVSDPNNHTESVAYGGNSIVSYDPENRAFITYRGDTGAPVGWNRAQGSFAVYGSGSFLEVKLLPYQIYSAEDMLTVSPDIGTKVGLTQESRETLVEVEVENKGAFLDDASARVGFNPDLFEYVGDEGQIVSRGIISIPMDRMENREVQRYELAFELVDGLAVGEYSGSFSAKVLSDVYLGEEVFANSAFAIEESEETQKPLVTYIEDTIKYLGATSSTSTVTRALVSQSLANTGIGAYPSVVVLFIMSVWLLVKINQKKKKHQKELYL